MSYEHGRNEGIQQGLEKGLERGRTEGLQEGIQQGLERGLERGRHEGLHEGRQEERARAVVEILRRRGVALTDEQAQQVLDCRDEATLTRWWERAWTIASADELT
jgi:flagellar biosynthesis/type III secretory pathway protein FliH